MYEFTKLNLYSTIIISLIYWLIVLFNAIRLKKETGKKPEIKPKSHKERLLWLGWVSILVAWLAVPFSIDEFPDYIMFRPMLPFSLYVLGVCVSIIGLIGTIWCYISFGKHWAISASAKRKELVQYGPFGLVRHPIYTFQFITFLGCFICLNNTAFALVIVFHAFCIRIKAMDEEKHLFNIFGNDYIEYSKRVPRFIPCKR